MLSWFGLIVVDVDFKAKPKLSTVGVGAADSTPGLVAALPTASGITGTSESV